MKNKHYINVIIGAALWGIIGIFVKELYILGLTTMQIVAARTISATVMLISYVYIKDKKLLVIEIKDLYYFISSGILSIVFFSWCYFHTINVTSISIAVILLYTAPAFVAVISRFVFGEKFTKKKIISLLLTFLGIILITNQTGEKTLVIPLLGIMTGLGSGFGYAMYSIIGKYALKKYNSLTFVTYTFIMGSIFLIPVLFTINPEIIKINFHLIEQIVLLGLFPTALAYIMYTIGLNNLEASKASITATIEPVVATVVGVLMFKEILFLQQYIGIFLILFSIILIQMKKKKQ